MLKHLIQRPRPFVVYDSLQLLIAQPLTYSFPSGHTLSSFAAAGVFAAKLKLWRFPIIALAALMGFSRLYLLVHYPSDVLCGALLGLLCAGIVLLVFSKKQDLLFHATTPKKNSLRY